MNRIILIGNGFDKAIGLPTLYGDFMDWFLQQLAIEINKVIPSIIERAKDNLFYKLDSKSKNDDFKNEFIKINTFNNEEIEPDYFDKAKVLQNIRFGKKFFFKYADIQRKHRHNVSDIDFINIVDYDSQYGSYSNKIIFTNTILELMYNNYTSESNWGNIEQIFYNELVKCPSNKIDKLNKDFQAILEKLEEYLKSLSIENEVNSLSKEEKDYITGYIFNNNFEQKYYCPIFVKKYFEEYVNKIKNLEKEFKHFTSKYGYFSTINELVNNSINKNIPLSIYHEETKNFDNYLILNFNYTNTPNYYIPDSQRENCKVINIHGDLSDNISTPIIFGFGDELDTNYKNLEDKNDDRYLKYIKSVNYLRNDNYRKLIEFLEFQPYQILILGHSCGTSDRTLLNTLFEHDNCISIVPFIRTDKDDYQDRIINIYRNFTDKKKLRNRVVNRQLCSTITLKE